MSKQKARPAGQKSIHSYLAPKNKQNDPSSEDEMNILRSKDASDSDDDAPPTLPLKQLSKKAHRKAAMDAEEDYAADAEIPHVSVKSSKKAAKQTDSVSDSDLPPIHDIQKMFNDLVERVPQIKDVAEHLLGRKLRVATMCSGTESPLLALELIRQAIEEQHGLRLDVEHVFSCEIEPYKQAYIERNFHPPILFRDVCELGEAEA
jgi:hypothetical protein